MPTVLKNPDEGSVVIKTPWYSKVLGTHNQDNAELRKLILCQSERENRFN